MFINRIFFVIGILLLTSSVSAAADLNCNNIPLSDKDYFLTMAEKGDIQAQIPLCVERLPQESIQAKEIIKWCSSLAEHGYVPAYFVLGQIYENGWGVPKDLEESYFWYSLADHYWQQKIAQSLTAEQISAIATRVQKWQPEKKLQSEIWSPKFRLLNIEGILCGGESQGCKIVDNCGQYAALSCSRDIFRKKYIFIDKTNKNIVSYCTADDGSDCEKFIAQNWNCGWPKDIPIKNPSDSSKECLQAPYDADYIRSAADDGNSAAQFIVAEEYMHKGEAAKAIKWFRRAAEQGYRYSQAMLATILSWDIKRKNEAPKFEYFQARAIARLAASPTDYTEAFKWYQKAAASGDEWAQYRLSVFYEEALGVTQNYEEAYFWIRLANKYDDYHYSENSTRLAQHLTSDKIQHVEKRIKEWTRTPDEFEPQKNTLINELINVKGIACDKSIRWHVTKTCNDLAVLSQYGMGAHWTIMFANTKTGEILYTYSNYGDKQPCTPPAEWTCGTACSRR